MLLTLIASAIMHCDYTVQYTQFSNGHQVIATTYQCNAVDRKDIPPADKGIEVPTIQRVIDRGKIKFVMPTPDDPNYVFPKDSPVCAEGISSSCQ